MQGERRASVRAHRMWRVEPAALKTRNSLLLREDLEARRVEFRGLPEVVSFQTTDICNLRCIMCPRALGPGRQRLPADILRQVCADLFPTAWKGLVTAAAGEPLGPDFGLILDEALRHGVKLDVFTNGLLLSVDRYRKARPALDQLNISLDSHVPETYERIRAGARWERILAVLEGLRAERKACPDDVILSFSVVVMKSNLGELAGFVRFAKRMGADVVVLQKLRHEVKRTLDEDPERNPGRAAAIPFVEAAVAAARECGINLHLSELGAPDVIVRELRPKVPEWIGDRYGTCWPVAQNFSVMPTGEVYPCCVPTDHVLGNVLFDPPLGIWNGRVARALRAAHFSRRGTIFCSGCLYAPQLPARRSAGLVHALRRARLAVAAARNSWRRWRAAVDASRFR